MSVSRGFLIVAALAGWGVAVAGSAVGQAQRAALALHEHPAIRYQEADIAPLVADANARLADARYDARVGHLGSLLEAFEIPAASQLLLFSKTGGQQNLTSPANPRALYFNDSVIVGHVPGAPVLEVAVHDPRGGARFYTVAQEPGLAPTLTPRQECLQCHLTPHTLDVPGFIARSTYADGSGRPRPDLGVYPVDHRREYTERWGGWFVTGAPDTLRHLGNTIVVDPGVAPRASVSDVSTLDGRVPVARYLSPFSDVTALAVFDHQMHAMNLLTRLAWEARVEASAAPADVTRGRLGERVRELADYLSFVDEAPLDGPIEGGAGFAEWFAARGPRDDHGRSLREFDRRTRLFRYPASYMVYSPAFEALPPEVRAAVIGRMRATLLGDEGAPGAPRFTVAERRAALDILTTTVRGF